MSVLENERERPQSAGRAPAASGELSFAERLASLPPKKRALLERQLREQGIDLSAIEITPRSPGEVLLPLSFAQQRLWFLHQLDPNDLSYNLVGSLRLGGPLVVRALHRAYGSITDRHESLRTTFETHNGQPRQRVHAAVEVLLPLVDLTALPEQRRTDLARALITGYGQRPFDLECGPLVRAALVRLGERDHALCQAMHHIVSDAWSMDIFRRELLQLYRAFAALAAEAEARAALQPLRVHYGDFALWQRKGLQGETLERQLDYWRSQLGDGVPPLELPTDRPRTAEGDRRGGAHGARLKERLVEAIDQVAGEERSTRFMVLLAGFQALLWRLTGQRDFAVGSTIANRNRREIEPMIGFFVNTRVLRADLSGDPSFRELLRRARRTALEADENQDVPFERLVQELTPERSLHHTPLFQVAFNFLQVAGQSEQAALAAQHDRLSVQPLGSDAFYVPFDLTAHVNQEADGLAVSFLYRASLFDRTRVKRMLHWWLRLLEVALAEPDRPLSALPLLSPAERHHLLHELDHQRFTAQSPGEWLPARVLALADRRRDATAVVDRDGGTLSYGELADRARALAAWLQQRGIGSVADTSEPVVGLLFERSAETLVASLGVQLAGAAYLPIDPATPRQRMTFMLRDAGASCLLANPELMPEPATSAERQLDSSSALPCGWLSLDEALAQAPASPPVTPPAARSRHSLAYIIYTSGSTGRPKGVAVPHGAQRNIVRCYEEELGLSAADRTTLIVGPAFDVSVGEIWPSLAVGATLYVPPDEVRADPVALRRWLAEREITVTFLPTPLAEAMLSEPSGAPVLSALRLLITGGDRLTRRAAAGEPFTLVNLYGPSENTVATSWILLAPQGPAGGPAALAPPIGRPLSNLRVYVVDPAGRPVPFGCAGELVTGGENLARGYLGRPGRTAGSFVPDPFGGEPGARLYRSGDLVRFLPDGQLHFMGRIDHQVKVRGFRIELGEIEAVLADHPSLAAASVVVREDRPGDRRIVAYYELAVGQGSPETSELQRHLARRLPDYMIPAVFLELESLPLTASGKVDRRALPAPRLSRDASGSEYVAPRTPIEVTLAAIWAQVLGVEKIGIHDSFFALGGHSMLATQAVSRVRAELAVEVPLMTLFESPTIAQWADRISEHVWSEGGGEVPPLVAVERQPGEALPLSFAQQRLWFLRQLDPHDLSYNLLAALRLEGPVVVSALHRAYCAITERHEALRTTFEARGGQPCQRVHRQLHTDLSLVDLSGLPQDARTRLARSLVTSYGLRPFDLEHGPLVRVALFRLSPHDHALSQTMHHIVSDAWSMDIFQRELLVLYRAYAAVGQRLAPEAATAEARTPASLLPPLRIHYGDFAVWQRKWLRGKVLERQLDYWRGKLGDGVPPLELPTDRPRGNHLSRLGGVRGAALPPEVAAAMDRIGGEERATRFMVLLAAFQALLWRLNGQSDFAVGSTIANRNRREIEPLIGFFVNTRVLRADLSGDPTFREALRRARRTALEAEEHQDIPFERLVQELAPERSLHHTPIFQVGYNYLQVGSLGERAAEAAAQDGLTVTQLGSDARHVPFDLSLQVRQAGEATALGLEYRSALFDPTSVERMVSLLARLVATALDEPDRPLASLPLISAAQHQQLIVELNDTGLADATFGTLTPVARLVESQARRQPRAAALLSEEGAALTYGELWRQATALAGWLRRRGAGPERVVALLVERSPQTLVAELATLLAGAAYLPLDPSWPVERLSFVVEDAGAVLLLAEERWSERVPAATAIETATVEEALAESLSVEPAGEWTGRSWPLPDPRSLAYLIYTSGSTGRPKGVGISHAALCNMTHWHLSAFGLSEDDHATLLAGPAFDASVAEIWPYLAAGATLHAPPAPVRAEPSRLLRWLAQSSISVTFLPTPLAEAVLAERGVAREGVAREGVAGEGAEGEGTIGSLRLLLTAGDRLTRRPRGDESFRLINQYGPTENAVASTFCSVLPESGDVTGAAPSIGRPLSSVRAYVTDRAGRPLPLGFTGELRLAGDSLARGYLGRPALTAAAFVPDDLSGTAGGRLYRTGDLVRYLADGRLAFLGRIDHQVKLRGFRIELGEVESVLAQHPAVSAAVAMVREDRPGDRRLVAYYQPAPGGEVADAGLLRGFLEQRLPDFMVPADWVRLDALPLTSNQKVDRDALPAPERGLAGRGVEYEAPRTPIEATVVGIWQEVLGLEKVGVHDHFFSLGGHSLLATQVVSRARAELAVEVPLMTLFESPTVAGWAQRIGDHISAGQDSEVPPLVPLERQPGEKVPLSFAQQRLWFLQELAPENPFYNIFTGFRLVGTFDLDALAATFTEIVRRHESLRTSFPVDAGQPYQRIAEAAPIHPPRIDISSLAEPRRERWRVRLAQRELDRVFDLARGPLLRVILVYSGPRQAAVLLNIHHIVADGWSAGVLFRELVVLYRFFSGRGASTSASALALAPSESPLPELEVQYADFARWQRGWLSGETLEREIDFWRQRLAGAPPALALPFDRPRPEVESFRGARHSFLLPRELVAKVRQLGRSLDLTLFMVLLASFKLLLRRYTGQGDIVVGSGIANRRFREIENLIGFFVNTLVLRTDLRGAQSFREALERVRDTTLAAYSHQDLPFEKLVDELQPDRSLSHNPICQLLFVVQNFPVETSADPLPDLSIQPLSSATARVTAGSAKFDMTVYLTEAGEDLLAELEYNTDLFDRATVARMGRHWEALLRGLLAAPEAPASAIELMDDSERQQVLREWAAVETPYPRGATVGELVAEQARLQPAAPALIFGTGGLGTGGLGTGGLGTGGQDEGSMSYGELNQAANRVAHFLRAAGIGPEDRVGVAMARSPQLVVALLGILKAGGAYVALDASFPARRLEHMMRETGVKLVLSDGTGGAAPEVDGVRVVSLAVESAALATHDDGEPRVPLSADNLAYIVFTSGSTGLPKGVAATHRAVVRLVKETQYTPMTPDETFLSVAPVSFDASTFELWAPLANGARLVLFPPHKPTIEELGEVIDSSGVTNLFVTTGLFHQMVEVCLPKLAGLRHVMTGGEVVSPVQVKKALESLPATTVSNIYGPTENTTFTCWYPMRSPEEVKAPLPIGRPIANSGMLVLDGDLRPAPVGVPGELYTSGDGLARGYFGQPARTAERFLPHPYPRHAGERVYRTGDQARWLAEGAIDFLGRDDHQVKVRGFRIELEEIETQLRGHPAVRDAAVLARVDGGTSDEGLGGKRLIGYVVQDPDYTGAEEAGEEGESEQVSDWELVFDDLYRKDAPEDDPTFNIIGWDSTYSGQPLPSAEMREWLDDTIIRIRSLRPKRVLEIGVGTGMLLFRIAPDCERYLGTDLSEEAIQYLQRTIGDRLPQVELAARAADVFDGIEPGSFDTVILNSVVQYFPSAEYFAQVIAGAVRALAPGGSFFLGDLRSKPLLEPFASDLELFQAPDELPLPNLRYRIQRRILQENELAVDPVFFQALAGRLPISRVEVFPKHGRAHNELTAYRYQVVLRVGESTDGDGRTASTAANPAAANPAAPNPKATSPAWIDADGEQLDLLRIHDLLAARPLLLALRGLPNVRVRSGVRAMALLSAGAAEAGEAPRTAGELRAAVAAGAVRRIDPADLEALAAEGGYEIEMGCAAMGPDGRFDALLRRRDESGPPLASLLPTPAAAELAKPLASYCTRPLQGRFLRRVVPALRRFLGDHLPDYMVPSAFVLMEEMPLNANGKIDRRALPAPDGEGMERDAPYAAPRSDTERALAAVWATVLGIDRVGVHDNFFHLGGHSLLATQVVSRVRKEMGVELPLRAFFETQTLAALAELVETMVWASGSAPPPPGASDVSSAEMEEGEL